MLSLSENGDVDCGKENRRKKKVMLKNDKENIVAIVVDDEGVVYDESSVNLN